ncbi:hypothetical protein B7R21_09480 [Subtercola boreus]|uniref:Uncharacterized protein n=1 Tax=Subtercola boreus TaxID=120213 RepID=A0A3E0VU75_9MICO|nr:hypothetical protein B7R21_09480 [Subtercola boreus]
MIPIAASQASRSAADTSWVTGLAVQLDRDPCAGRAYEVRGADAAPGRAEITIPTVSAHAAAAGRPMSHGRELRRARDGSRAIGSLSMDARVRSRTAESADERSARGAGSRPRSAGVDEWTMMVPNVLVERE